MHVVVRRSKQSGFGSWRRRFFVFVFPLKKESAAQSVAFLPFPLSAPPLSR